MGIAIEMRATVLGFAGLVASASAFAPAGLPVAAKRTAGYTAPQMGVKTGINGFGRIGRQVARIIIESDDADLLQINAGSATPDYMAYQYKYDSIHGRVGHEVAVEGDDLILKGKRVVTTRARDPAEIGWTKTGVDYLCESTGVFLTEEKAKAHVDAGVKKVIFSAPAKDDSLTVVMGVNAKVIPQVKGKLTGMAFRVPTIDVSVVDLTCRLKTAATYEEICAEVEKQS